jgi:hypothetical protein
MSSSSRLRSSNSPRNHNADVNRAASEAGAANFWGICQIRSIRGETPFASSARNPMAGWSRAKPAKNDKGIPQMTQIHADGSREKRFNFSAFLFSSCFSASMSGANPT